MKVELCDSPCATCRNCIMVSPGYPATREEPAEEPEFVCEEESDNFSTKDGCWSYMRQEEEE